MGRSERRKGVEGEREVARILRTFGVDCDRVPNSGGLLEPGDLTGIPGWHIEVKRQEVVRLPLWLAQAEAEAGDSHPVVIYRRSLEPWRAVVRIGAFAGLLRAWQEKTPCGP